MCSAFSVFYETVENVAISPHLVSPYDEQMKTVFLVKSKISPVSFDLATLFKGYYIVFKQSTKN